MSNPLFLNDVLFFQRFLSCAGFYSGPLDGKWSAAVDEASLKFDAETAAIKALHGKYDSRTEGHIMTMQPKAQVLARQFMKALVGFKHTVKIISGTRSYAEQDALYALGRTVRPPNRTVTNAEGGESNHNFSIAWDIGIFDAATGAYFTGATAAQRKAYADVAALTKAALQPELEWGGDWVSFQDPPHYQHKSTKSSTAKVRAAFEAGKPYI
jgi:peptidoglycan L-alanyl-D-glutamate endopeptidase CwlK